VQTNEENRTGSKRLYQKINRNHTTKQQRSSGSYTLAQRWNRVRIFDPWPDPTRRLL